MLAAREATAARLRFGLRSHSASSRTVKSFVRNLPFVATVGAILCSHLICQAVAFEDPFWEDEHEWRVTASLYGEASDAHAIQRSPSGRHYVRVSYPESRLPITGVPRPRSLTPRVRPTRVVRCRPIPSDLLYEGAYRMSRSSARKLDDSQARTNRFARRLSQ